MSAHGDKGLGRVQAEKVKAALSSAHGDINLIGDLAQAEKANQHGRACQVCEALELMSEEARAGVSRALAGTIGERKLAEILTRNGYPTGRRAVANHRQEGH